VSTAASVAATNVRSAESWEFCSSDRSWPLGRFTDVSLSQGRKSGLDEQAAIQYRDGGNASANVVEVPLIAAAFRRYRSTANSSAARKQTLQPHDSKHPEHDRVFGKTLRLFSPDQFEKMQMSLR